MWTTPETIAALALAFSVIAAVVNLTWGLGKIRSSVRDEFYGKIDDEYKAFTGKIETQKKDFSEEMDIVRHEIGETVGAIREKVREVELWTRDNLVSKEAFSAITDRISRDIRDVGERVERRLERMEGKIDHVQL